MAASPMRLDMNFNRKDKDGAFSYNATMGAMNATLLNRFGEPFSLMSVKSGRINRMYTHVDADGNNARGKVDLYYSDMKFALLKKDDKNDQLKDREAITGGAGKKTRK